MIRPQFYQMQREFMEIIIPPDFEARDKRQRDWWDKWVQVLGASEKFDRLTLQRMHDAQGLLNHVHKRAHLKMGEMIQERELSIVDLDFDGENPFEREDLFYVYILGRK